MSKTEWTIETLKQLFEQKFDSLEEAVTKAENATNDRFASVNEFRNTLSDQQRTFMPRLETEVLFRNHENVHESQNKKMDEIMKKMDKIESMKAGGNVVWAYVLAAISLLIGIIGVALKL